MFACWFMRRPCSLELVHIFDVSSYVNCVFGGTWFNGCTSARNKRMKHICHNHYVGHFGLMWSSFCLYLFFNIIKQDGCCCAAWPCSEQVAPWNSFTLFGGSNYVNCVFGGTWFSGCTSARTRGLKHICYNHYVASVGLMWFFSLCNCFAPL